MSSHPCFLRCPGALHPRHGRQEQLWDIKMRMRAMDIVMCIVSETNLVCLSPVTGLCLWSQSNWHTFCSQTGDRLKSHFSGDYVQPPVSV